uniref:Mitochondrial ribosomal protein L12 n=1 Tax=Panagrolaimus sp. JU765 TaxID=591449 RepID=A0AC34RI03_9BILA
MLVARVVNRYVLTAVRAYSAAAPAVAEGVPTSEGPSSSAPSEKRNIAPHIQNLVDQIANLPLLEVADLNYALKKKLNLPDAPVMPAGMMMAAAAPAPGAGASQPKEDDIPQKMTFAVKLAKFDDTKKIALIKEIRNILPNLNLVQAKKFVETAPVEVKNDLGKAEAEELKAALEKVGATVELKTVELVAMARGHQKAQAQAKNQKKQEQMKKAQGSDQKTAALKALTHKCVVCFAMMPDPKTYRQHFESRHPKNTLPAELNDVAA